MLIYILLVPAVLALLVLPFIIKGRPRNKSGIKRRLLCNLAVFAVICVMGIAFPLSSYAETANPEAAAATEQQEESGNIAGTAAQGMGFIAAALVTGLASLGAGIAVAAGAPAAIGAISEDPKSFGKAIIFVVLGEGIAIYGLLISILIINKL